MDVGVRGILSLLRLALVLMQVVVLSAATGELVWDYTSGSLWRARGWELRMWLCEAIHCGLLFLRCPVRQADVAVRHCLHW